MSDRDSKPAPAPEPDDDENTPPDSEPTGYDLRGRTLKQATPGLSCELCGGPVLDRHCKVVCLNCGYIRDCSDP